MSDPLIGATLDGRYRIEAQLEDEVLGRVFAAKDLRGGPVHIKILHDFLAQNREKVSRFERESRAMAAMRHPNLIAMLGEGQVAGRPYLVLERVEGQPLEALLAAGPMPPERAAAQILRGVARGQDRILVGGDAVLLDLLQRAFPVGYAHLLRWGQRWV